MATVYFTSVSGVGWLVPCVYLVSVSSVFNKLYGHRMGGDDFAVYVLGYPDALIPYIGQLIVQHCIGREIIAEKLCVRRELERFAREFDVPFLATLLIQ